MTVFIIVWPVLKSLPPMGTPRSFASFDERRDVGGEVGRAVGERDALHERGVGVEHRRRDVDVVGLHRRLERFEVLVAGVLGR